MTEKELQGNTQRITHPVCADSTTEPGSRSMRELWDVRQLARRWAIKPSWIYQHIRKLPHYKIGNHLRFDPLELEQFLLEKARRGPKSPQNGKN